MNETTIKCVTTYNLLKDLEINTTAIALIQQKDLQ